MRNMTTDSCSDRSKLTAQGNQLLKQSGFRRDGRRRGSVDGRQTHFERRLVKVAAGAGRRR